MRDVMESTRVSVGPWDLHVRVSTSEPDRDEPPVVLVHGLGVSARHMEPAARQLASRFPVFVPDLPGYGDSPRPWAVLGVADLAEVLVEVLNELHIERAVFGSISFGCQIVVHLATEHPERVAACVLVGPTIDVDDRNAVSQVVKLLLDAPREPLGLFPVVLRDYLGFGLRRGAVTLWHALADDVVEKLPLLTAPTLVVRGAHDPIVPPAWVERMVSLLPHGEGAEIPGAAHAANFSHPAEFADLLTAFVAELEHSGAGREA